MKFLHYNKKHKTKYLAEWKDGYILLSSDWGQLRFKRFNWITFVLAEFEFERELGNGITIRLGLLGFRLMFYWLWRESQVMKDLVKESKKIKKGLKEGKSDKELELKELKI